jgi:hypothetical protein
MKTSFRLLAVLSLATALVSLVRAADIDGKWKAEFDSQIGVQKYTFDLKSDGEKLTGMAHSERADGSKSDTALTEGKVTKDQVSFVEPLKLQDFDLRIEYTGKLAGDELKLTRKVGDFGTEEIVAKRVKDEPAKG